MGLKTTVCYAVHGKLQVKFRFKRIMPITIRFYCLLTSGRLSSAETQRQYRERIRADPEKLRAYKERAKCRYDLSSTQSGCPQLHLNCDSI